MTLYLILNVKYEQINLQGRILSWFPFIMPTGMAGQLLFR